MKKYRVTYKLTERASDPAVAAEEVVADGWKVDSGLVCLYQRDGDSEIKVFDVPKARIMRIQEI